MHTAVDNVTFKISAHEDGPVRNRFTDAMDEAQRAQAENGAFHRNPYSTPNKEDGRHSS